MGDSMVTEASNDLAICRRQLADNRASALVLVEGMSDPQMLWRPGPRSWSIAECFLHMLAAARPYLTSIDEGIARARAKGHLASRTARHPWLARVFVESFEPPPRIRYPAPKQFLPPAPRGPATVIVGDFMRLGDEIGDRLDRAEGLDLGKPVVVSPVSSVFRLSLGLSFALLSVHERRHLYQARAVTRRAAFPAVVTS
jgi:hypothetical protein